METFFLDQSLSTSTSYLIIQKLHFQFNCRISMTENIPLTEMLSSLRVAVTDMLVYCFHWKHLTSWDLCGMLETANFVQKDSKKTIRIFQI